MNKKSQAGTKKLLARLFAVAGISVAVAIFPFGALQADPLSASVAAQLASAGTDTAAIAALVQANPTMAAEITTAAVNSAPALAAAITTAIVTANPTLAASVTSAAVTAAPASAAAITIRKF